MRRHLLDLNKNIIFDFSIQDKGHIYVTSSRYIFSIFLKFCKRLIKTIPCEKRPSERNSLKLNDLKPFYRIKKIQGERIKHLLRYKDF